MTRNDTPTNNKGKTVLEKKNRNSNNTQRTTFKTLEDMDHIHSSKSPKGKTPTPPRMKEPVKNVSKKPGHQHISTNITAFRATTPKSSYTKNGYLPRGTVTRAFDWFSLKSNHTI